MSVVDDELGTIAPWRRPPKAEWDDEDTYTLPLPRTTLVDNQVKLRVVKHRFTYGLIEFALVYRTLYRASWCDVVEIDSCHDVDVHLHQYGRQAKSRIGEPGVLLAIGSMEDVQRGYETAMSNLEKSWEQLRERWHHA